MKAYRFVVAAFLLLLVAMPAAFAAETVQEHMDNAILAEMDGDYDDAIAECNKAIDLDPNYADAYAERGYNYNSKKYYDQAIADETKAIELNPNFSFAYAERGYDYYNQRNYYQAIKDCNKAIEIDSKNDRAYQFRGYAYTEQGNYEQAVADETTAIGIRPDGWAYVGRACAYEYLQQYDKAWDDVHKAQSMGIDVNDVNNSYPNLLDDLRRATGRDE